MKDFARLSVYVRDGLGAEDEFRRYRPYSDTVRAIAARLPSARVEVVAAASCDACRREVPRFARVAERLAGWEVVLLGDDAGTRRRLAIGRIPTFIVRSADDGAELGRIVGSPAHGSLEADLLAIAEAHPSHVLA